MLRHQRGHSGVKPFQCQMCGAAYTRKDKLNYHLAHVHDLLGSADQMIMDLYSQAGSPGQLESQAIRLGQSADGQMISPGKLESHAIRLNQSVDQQMVSPGQLESQAIRLGQSADGQIVSPGQLESHAIRLNQSADQHAGSPGQLESHAIRLSQSVDRQAVSPGQSLDQKSYDQSQPQTVSPGDQPIYDTKPQAISPEQSINENCSEAERISASDSDQPITS